MSISQRVLPLAFAGLLLAALPACSSETGDRATTDAPAGSNEADVRTHDSGGAMEEAVADSTVQQTGGTVGQGTEPAAGGQ